MRENTLAFHAWITIALILFTVPALPVVPSASAVELPSHTLWRPYGPYVKQVLITVFTNEISELAAFQSGQLDWYDWVIPRAQIPGLIANPDALVSPPARGVGRFQIDINHHFPMLGIAQQQPRVDFTTIQDGRFFEHQSTMEPTPAGIHVRQAIAHLIDKASFVRDASPCAGGFCEATDDPMAPLGCLEDLPPCSTLSQRAAWDTLHPTCAAVGATTPCAYHLAPGPGQGRPSTEDLQAAREHFLAAGLRDDDRNGLIDFPASGQIVFAIRADDPRRNLLGTVMADALDSLFDRGPRDEPIVRRVIGSIQIGLTIFLSEPADDWHLYTGGWSSGFDASHLFVLHDSYFASNFCGGPQSLFNLNYGFYCNPAFDEAVERGTFDAKTVDGFNLHHQKAVDIAGKTIMTIPVYSRSGVRTLAHNGWDGVVDTWGNSIADTFNWFNMRQKPGYVSTGGLGLPGGGNPDLLRAGFRQGTSRLNIFHAGSVWEAYIIFNILDSPGGFNPVTNPFLGQPYETSVISVKEAFNDNGADQRPGTPDDEPVTVIEMIFRNDLQFHDGVQVTAVDFLKSGLAFRDVPMGGFGFASTWAPLLSSFVPIPDSNCGNLCVQLVLKGQSFLHRPNIFESPILPLHLWDTNGDGFVCSALGIGSCQGRAADPTTDVNFDPMAARIMVGHGPWMCLSPSGVPGGSCSRTAAGNPGGQSIGPGGSFLLTRFDGYVFCCPTKTGTPLHRFSLADVNKDWKIDLTDFVLAAGDQALQALIIASLDQKLGGAQGKVLTGVDLTNTGNLYPVA